MLSLLAVVVAVGSLQEWQPKIVISVASQPDLHPKVTLTDFQDVAFRNRLNEQGEFHLFEDRERGVIVIFHETVARMTATQGAITFWQRLSRGKLGGLDHNSYVGQEVRKILEGHFGGTLTPQSEDPYLGLAVTYYIDGRTIPGRKSISIGRSPEIRGQGYLREDRSVPPPPRLNPGQGLQSSWSVQTIDGVGLVPAVEFSEIVAWASESLSVKQSALMQEFMRVYQDTSQGYVQQDFPGLAPHVFKWVLWDQLPADFRSYFRASVVPPNLTGFRSERAFNEWEATNPKVRVMPTLSLTARVQGTPEVGRALSIVLAPPWEREAPATP